MTLTTGLSVVQRAETIFVDIFDFVEEGLIPVMNSFGHEAGIDGLVVESGRRFRGGGRAGLSIGLTA